MTFISLEKSPHPHLRLPETFCHIPIIYTFLRILCFCFPIGHFSNKIKVFILEHVLLKIRVLKRVYGVLKLLEDTGFHLAQTRPAKA